MKKGFALTLGLLFFNILLAYSQELDSLTLEVNTVESRELLDFYRFEEINYFKTRLYGEGIGNQYFVLTSSEYWSGEPVKVDTIANTKLFGMKNGSDTIAIRVMSKKINPDTVKFQFHLPRFSTTKKFPTTTNETYSLRDITSNQQQKFATTQSIDILVYSLPYEDPERPGYLFYCELSRNGIPPEKWGEKFGVEHYIVFKLQLIV